MFLKNIKKIKSWLRCPKRYWQIFWLIIRIKPRRIMEIGIIKGTVVHDRNATGFWERGELPLLGWTIVLTCPDGSQSTMLTDMSGKYEFSKLSI